MPAAQRERVVARGIGETRGHLVTGHHAEQHVASFRAPDLRRGEGGGDLARARVAAAAYSVQLAQMRVGAVEKRGELRRGAARRPPYRARSRRSQILAHLLKPRRFRRRAALDRAPQGVEHDPLGHPRHLGGQILPSEPGDPSSQGLGDGGSRRPATCHQSPRPHRRRESRDTRTTAASTTGAGLPGSSGMVSPGREDADDTLTHGAFHRSRGASPGLNIAARSSAHCAELGGRLSSTVPRASICASVGHQK